MPVAAEIQAQKLEGSLGHRVCQSRIEVGKRSADGPEPMSAVTCQADAARRKSGVPGQRLGGFSD